MPYTYVLYSGKLNKYYVGSCINQNRRLHQHNIGQSKFTSLGSPWIVAYVEEYEMLQEARQRELQLKQMKSRKYIERLIAKGGASRF